MIDKRFPLLTTKISGRFLVYFGTLIGENYCIDLMCYELANRTSYCWTVDVFSRTLRHIKGDVFPSYKEAYEALQKGQYL